MNATTANTTELQPGLITAWLRGIYARHAAKLLARDADVDVRTAEAWLAGARLPQTLHFVRLARRHTELLAQIAMLPDGDA